MDNNLFNKNPEIFNYFNQKTYNPSNNIYQEYNNNNKNSISNKMKKDSYIYLHSKKLNNNKKNIYQSFDYSEPQPQIFQGFTHNNNSFDILSYNNEIISNNILNTKKIFNNKLNNNISNRNTKKLLEEYFQLKKDYNTFNNINFKQKEGKHDDIIKKNKVKNNKEQKRNISFKKSCSLKDNLLQIYQPEKNITNSPSFTPIRNVFQKQKNNNKKEKSPYFNSKSNVNIKVNSKKNSFNNIVQRKKTNTKINNSHEESFKSLNNNNDYKNKKNKIGNKAQTIRKNLTPSKIKGIWVESNNINYNKTYSINDNNSNNNNNNINIRNNNTHYNVSNYFHSNNSSNTNRNVSSKNTTELYWKRKDKEKEAKLEQIRTERILKEEKELQDRPKINLNSKKLINKKVKKIDVFDRLSDLNQIKNHNQQIEKMRQQLKESHIPFINDSSRKMKRTIDDLINWKNKNERKKTESANNFNKMMKRKQIKVNPLSEEILKEKKSEYLNKKVEDRLLEQGRIQQYKNEIERQKYMNYITTGKKYINNDYINVQSRYLESPNSTNNNFNPKNYKSCERIAKREYRNKYKNIPLNNKNKNNSFDYNKGDSFDKSEINNFNNDNMREKLIYFNKNDNELINGNINNYFNNNINNNIQNKDNFKEKNNYQYFPNYNRDFHNQNENNNNDNDIYNNYKEIKNKFIYKGFQTDNNYNYNKDILSWQNNSIKSKGSSNLINKNNNEKVLDNISYKNSDDIISLNTMNNYEKNEIINIRKHLNEFYENKKKNNTNYSNKFNDSNSVEQSLKKDKSIKNDLLKDLLNNNNKEKNYDYYNNNQIDQTNFKNNEDNNNNNNQKNNNININDIKPKYNFKSEIIKNIKDKVPKSSGLNFNTNKNINYFQFQFNKYNNNDNNLEYQIKDYEINNQNNNDYTNIIQNQNNIQNNNNQNQNNFTIQDSININGLVQNSNLINIDKNINLNSKMKENCDNDSCEKEKERRKQDLLQMMNYSSNFGYNCLKNNIQNDNNNYMNILQSNKNDIVNFNGTQSYEDNEN